MMLRKFIMNLTVYKFGATKTAILALTVLGFVLASPSCYADETFQFSGNITPYYFLPSGATQSFSFEAPDFITQDIFIPENALLECSTGYYATCGGVSFLPSSPGYGIPGQVVQIAFWDGVVNPYYYFPLAAFTVDGTYTTVDFQGANTGTLIVTKSATMTPEPGPLSLIVAPLAILLLAFWYRGFRNKRAFFATTF
jgi:hypothetical protein